MPPPGGLYRLLRPALALTGIAIAIATAWLAIPRPADRPMDLTVLRLSGPSLALLATVLAVVHPRLRRRAGPDDLLAMLAVMLLILGSGTAAGLLEAVRIQDAEANP